MRLLALLFLSSCFGRSVCLFDDFKSSFIELTSDTLVMTTDSIKTLINNRKNLVSIDFDCQTFLRNPNVNLPIVYEVYDEMGYYYLGRSVIAEKELFIIGCYHEGAWGEDFTILATHYFEDGRLKRVTELGQYEEIVKFGWRTEIEFQLTTSGEIIRRERQYLLENDSSLIDTVTNEFLW